MVDSLVKPFIGSQTQVIQGNQSYIGLSGRIVDDKKNAFILEIDGNKKTVLKKGTVFMINKQIVYGDTLQKRIADRIKLRR
jgi:RNase P/RNase MRP subunit p29